MKADERGGTMRARDLMNVGQVAGTTRKNTGPIEVEEMNSHEGTSADEKIFRLSQATEAMERESTGVDPEMGQEMRSGRSYRLGSIQEMRMAQVIRMGEAVEGLVVRPKGSDGVLER
jgi:hypothetical protein